MNGTAPILPARPVSPSVQFRSVIDVGALGNASSYARSVRCPGHRACHRPSTALPSETTATQFLRMVSAVVAKAPVPFDVDEVDSSDHAPLVADPRRDLGDPTRLVGVFSPATPGRPFAWHDDCSAKTCSRGLTDMPRQCHT